MTGGEGTRTLPRRDWLLLPLVMLLTALAVLAATEGVARVGWPESKTAQCTLGSNSATPNCAARVKAAEGPWVDYRFNGCGYRATGPCTAPAPHGRIAVIGSSTSWGYLVPFENVWSVEAAREIAARCGAAPDVQSLGGFGSLNDTARRLPEALKLKPTLVALVVTPFDIFEMPPEGFDPLAVPLPGGAEKPPQQGLMAQAKGLIGASRAATVAQQFLYRNADTYTSTYLRYGDKADFMRPPFTPAWAKRLAYVEAATAYIAERVRAAGVPLLIVYAPQQAQADIIAGDMRLPHVDAGALNHAIGANAAKNGAMFVDGADMFRGVKDAPGYFYRADGHFNARGHAMLGRLAAGTLFKADLPGLCDGARS